MEQTQFNSGGPVTNRVKSFFPESDKIMTNLPRFAQICHYLPRFAAHPPRVITDWSVINNLTKLQKVLDKLLLGLVQSAPFKQDLTKLHLIAAGHKKDLTSHRNCTIIGAGYTKVRIVTLLLAPTRRKIDHDFFHEFGHKFPAKM